MQIFQPVMVHFGTWTKTMTYLWVSESGDDSAPLCCALMGLSAMTSTALSVWLISLCKILIEKWAYLELHGVLKEEYGGWVSMSSQLLIQLELVRRSLSCKVLSGLCKPLTLPISLLCLSRADLLPWVQSGPMTTGGETSRAYDADDTPTKLWKDVVCVGMGFWRLDFCSPCQLACLPRVGSVSLIRLQCVLHSHTSCSEMEAMKSQVSSHL